MMARPPSSSCDHIFLIHEGRAVLAGELEQVRASFGSNTVHLVFEGDGAFLSGLPGVAAARVDTNAAEPAPGPGADTQAVLTAALGKVRVSRFEIAAPSLEEIFIDRVGAGALERRPAEVMG